jgi:cell division protease FtsH
MLAFLGYYDFKEWAEIWVPTLLVVVLILVLVLAARQMRPTKPQQIKPEAPPQIAWDEIAGVDEAKDELREVVDFMRDPTRFRRLGASVPRGVLLHGPPGTGKTLLAKAVAHESGANFFAQSAAAFVEMFAGLGAARIRRLFRIARKHAPAIVFIDELDAVGGRRGSDISGERDQTLNQLLVEMDGFTARGDVVVIAASNLLDKLDPALLRPGRFDRQIFVAPPDRRGRERILAVHTRGKPLAPSVDLELIARQTSGLTGADLANICNEAAIFAGRRDVDLIGAIDFDAALERVVAGMQARRGLNDHEKRIVAYHEAGHALCAELLPAVDRVHRISIVPRGRALGYTLNLPDEDRYLKTREELVDRMTMLLGGRAAEQLVFGSVTTGAAGDYQHVTALAAAMIDEYAMGTRVKLQRPDHDHGAESTRRLRDEEQADLADGAERAALALLRGHRRWLDALAEALLEQEVLERADIDRLLADLPRAPAAPSAGGAPGIAAAD